MENTSDGYYADNVATYATEVLRNKCYYGRTGWNDDDIESLDGILDEILIYN